MDTEQASLTVDREHYEYAAGKAGMGFEEISLDAFVLPTGAVELRRRYTLDAHSIIPRIDTYVQVPERDPDGQARAISSDDTDGDVSLDDGQAAILRRHAKIPGRETYYVEFQPQLEAGKRVHYELASSFPPGTFAIGLTQAEIARRQEFWDYVTWSIRFQTWRLVVSISLPAFSAPDIYRSEVQYADINGYSKPDQVRVEVARLPQPTLLPETSDRVRLSLTVHAPQMGFFYGVKWLPKPID